MMDSVVMTGVTSASQDARGILYVGTESGDVLRLSENFQTDILYSPARPAKVTLLEASNSLRTFVFYNDLQEFIYLDRFLTESARYSLEDFTTFANMVAPSLDNNIWIFDQQQFLISKLNPLTRAIQLTIPLERSLPPGNYSIGGMFEYQNQLFLADLNNGILLFDNLGNYIDMLPIRGLRHISFYQNSIIASVPEGLLILDIYSGNRKSIELSISPEMSFQNNNGFTIVRENTIYSLSEK
jgi:hypothetical protein